MSKEQDNNHVGRDASCEEVSQPNYWDQIYQESESRPGWDLGEVNPEFPWRYQHETPTINPGRMVVLGCGFGHEALFFAKKKFQVLAVDFSSAAIEGAKKLFQSHEAKIELLEEDLFQLSDALHGQFDYVLEHTCFCAIHPSRRQEYAKLCANLLKPEGQLLGLFYHHRKEGGPPWDVTPEEVRSFFEPFFQIKTLALASHNLERRRGKELYARFWKLSQQTASTK